MSPHRDSVAGIENFGREVFRYYNNNYGQLATELGIRIRIISYPELTTESINPPGETEFVWLSCNRRLLNLYTPSELGLMTSPECLSFVGNRASSLGFRIELISDMKSELKEETEKYKALSAMIYKTCEKKIENLEFTSQLNSAIGFLHGQGVSVDRLLENMDSKTCSYCGCPSVVIPLECGHKYCSRCFVGVIQTITQGLFVLNMLEKENTQGILCLVNQCNQVIGDEIIKQHLPYYEEYEKQAEARIDLTCACGARGKLDNFMIKCHHMCNECLFDHLRNGGIKCPECNDKIKESDMKVYRSCTTQCESCRNKRYSVSCFIKRLCNHNLCVGCLSECTGGLCPYDMKPFPNKEKINFHEINRKKCGQCGEKFPKISYLNMNKNCECDICEHCQYNNSVVACALCGTEFTEDLKLWLMEKKNADAEQSKFRVKDCSICGQTCPVEAINCLVNCGHYFCKDCFNANVGFLASENDIDKISKCPDCNVDILGGQLQHLVSKEILDKISYLSLLKTTKLIKCPQCRTEFIPDVKRRVICLNTNCGYPFCKECEGPYHEDGTCQEKFILERVKDLEALGDENGITQCPRCRLPYIKDKGCEHVKCLGLNCGVEFCFKGACLRSPTMAHGNHYHRPQCKFYYI